MGVPRMVTDPGNRALLRKGTEVIVCQSPYQPRRALTVLGLRPMYSAWSAGHTCASVSSPSSLVTVGTFTQAKGIPTLCEEELGPSHILLLGL